MKNLLEKCSTTQARAYLYRLYIVAESLKEEHPEIFTKAIQSIAFALYSSGQKREATRIFDEAEEAVKGCLPEIKDLIFYRQLQYKLKIDQTNAKEAERLIALMESPENIARGWCEVGVVQNKEGNTADTKDAFEKSLEFTKQVEDQGKRLHLQMELTYIMFKHRIMWLGKPLLNETKKEINALGKANLAVHRLIDMLIDSVRLENIGYFETEEQLTDVERMLQEHELSDVKRAEYMIEISANFVKKKVKGLEEFDNIIDETQNLIGSGHLSKMDLSRVLRYMANAAFDLGCAGVFNTLNEAIKTAFEIKDEVASYHELYQCVKLLYRMKGDADEGEIKDVLAYLENQLFEKRETKVEIKTPPLKTGPGGKKFPFTYNIPFPDILDTYEKGSPHKSKILVIMAKMASSRQKKFYYLKRARNMSSKDSEPSSTLQARCKIARALLAIGEIEHCWSVMDSCMEIARTSDVLEEVKFMIPKIADTLCKIMKLPPKQWDGKRKYRKRLPSDRWLLPSNVYPNISLKREHFEGKDDVMFG